MFSYTFVLENNTLLKTHKHMHAHAWGATWWRVCQRWGEWGGLRWRDDSLQSLWCIQLLSGYTPTVCVRLTKGFISLTSQIPQKEQTQGKKCFSTLTITLLDIHIYIFFTISPTIKLVKLSQDCNESWNVLFLYSRYHIMCWKTEYCWDLMFFVHVMLFSMFVLIHWSQ